MKKNKRMVTEETGKIRYLKNNSQAECGKVSSILEPRKMAAACGEQPTANKIHKFWTSIVGQQGEFDSSHKAITRWKELMREKCSQGDDGEKVISDEMWENVCKSLKAFKAAGPDSIRNYVYRKVPEVSELLRKQVEGMLNERIEIPQWLVTGRSRLVHKGGPTAVEANYRPIACLNTAYKVMTTVIAKDLTAHCVSDDILPTEQRAMRRGTWGTIDCLLTDDVVTKYAKIHGKRLSVAWIDYQKSV